LRLRPDADVRPKPRSKKLQRVRSASDIVEGTTMKKLSLVKPGNVAKVEPLAVQCKQCNRRRAFESIVAIEVCFVE
jgi:hypothetical protein